MVSSLFSSAGIFTVGSIFTAGFFSIGVDLLLFLTTALYLLKLLVVDLMGGPAGVKEFFTHYLVGSQGYERLGLESFSSNGPALYEVGEKRSLLHQNVSRRAW
jgi:hypothetical protein